jgi:hypothetical protein
MSRGKHTKKCGGIGRDVVRTRCSGVVLARRLRLGGTSAMVPLTKTTKTFSLFLIGMGRCASSFADPFSSEEPRRPQFERHLLSPRRSDDWSRLDLGHVQQLLVIRQLDNDGRRRRRRWTTTTTMDDDDGRRRRRRRRRWTTTTTMDAVVAACRSCAPLNTHGGPEGLRSTHACVCREDVPHVRYPPVSWFVYSFV